MVNHTNRSCHSESGKGSCNTGYTFTSQELNMNNTLTCCHFQLDGILDGSRPGKFGAEILLCRVSPPCSTHVDPTIPAENSHGAQYHVPRTNLEKHEVRLIFNRNVEVGGYISSRSAEATPRLTCAGVDQCVHHFGEDRQQTRCDLPARAREPSAPVLWNPRGQVDDALLPDRANSNLLC